VTNPHPGFPRAVWLAAVIGLVGAVCARAAPPRWRMLETPQFTVLSQLGEKPTRAWAEEFNQFVAELRRVFKSERTNLPALTVVMFARDRDFSRYQPLRPDGRGPAPVGGFFNHDGNWSIIGLADRYTERGTRELIFHEGVHWFTSVDPVNYPVWLSEGLAEVFSTFTQTRGKVRWGADIPEHVALLRGEKMLPFERFLFTTRDDPLFNETDRSGMFYAQSWVFVHYLLFGDHDGARDALANYFDIIGAGNHPDDAFERAFGQDYDRMAETLARYVRSGRYFKTERPESPTARITAPVTAPPAEEVETALARLAFASRRDDVARPHAERAIALAPDHPGGYDVLAQLNERAGDHAAARDACARAERLDTHDASTLFLLAYLTATDEMSRGGIAAPQARFIANLYRRAIAACPTFEQAYKNLAAVAPALDEVQEGDMDALRQGARMFPQRGEIMLGLASMVAHVGDRATARALLDRARGRSLPLAQQNYAEHLLESWIYDDYSARIKNLIEENRLAEALTAYDELIPQVSNVHARGSLLRNRQTLAAQIRLAEADTTARAGDYVTTRRILEGLLAETALPAGLRRLVEQRLERLPATGRAP
jgi:hypothetical protein